MKKFVDWINEQNTLGTDEVDSQIDRIYDKAKYAIKIAQMYVKSSSGPEKNLLKNISTVAPLNSGVYGLYNSSENKAVIGEPMSNQMRFTFRSDLISQQDNIQKLPITVIRQHIPSISPDQIKPSDVIHVNVQKIVSELGDSIEAIIQIASTIIHEATHEFEYRSTGKTNEIGPKKAESLFMSWVSNNWDKILNTIPQLRMFKFNNR